MTPSSRHASLFSWLLSAMTRTRFAEEFASCSSPAKNSGKRRDPGGDYQELQRMGQFRGHVVRSARIPKLFRSH